MKEDFYNLLGITKKSTDFEIYRAFSNLMIDIDSLDEITKEKYIDAFIAL